MCLKEYGSLDAGCGSDFSVEQVLFLSSAERNMGKVQQCPLAPKAATRSAGQQRKLRFVLNVAAIITPKFIRSLLPDHQLVRTTKGKCRQVARTTKGKYCQHLTRNGTFKLRRHCKDPSCGGGTAFCVHGLHRQRCKDPSCGGGTALCAHGLRRQRCKDPSCGGGTEFCTHGKQKHFCATCVEAGTSKRFCSICFSTLLSSFRRAAGRTECAGCDKARPPRVEHVFRSLLISKLPSTFSQPSAVDDVLFGGETGCDSKRHRPDLLWICHEGKFAVEVEIDENAHHTITPTCDLARVSRLYDSIITASSGTVNDVVFIRVAIYNGGEQIEKLSDMVAEKIKSLTDEASCSFPKGTGAPILIYLNYDKTSEAIDHVAEATSGFGVDGVVVL